MADDRRYPALIIQTGDDDHRKRRAGGGSAKAFGNVEEAKRHLVSQFEEIKDRLVRSSAVPSQQVGIAHVKYREDAIAKSHRAVELFIERTCPIIGDHDGPGEPLILVSPTQVDSAIRRVRDLGGRAARHLTSIESIELLGAEQRFPQHDRSEVREALVQEDHALLNIRVPGSHLFSPLYRDEVERRLMEVLGSPSRPYVTLGQFSLYSVTIRSMEQAMAIAAVQVIDRIELMPTFRTFGADYIDIASLRLTSGVAIDELPIVGVVDTGIEDTSPLEPLIWHRDQRVPTALRDTSHGTAVAANVVSGGVLTGASFTPRARLLDAAIVPANGRITLVDLVERLEELLDLYAAEVRDWNLSLGQQPGMRPTEFSLLGQILDNFHKRYGVQFYIAAGNCEAAHCRMAWPPTGGAALHDYVSSPGDALCGITVGSCAPRDTPVGAAVPPLAPAPYTARGPVAAWVRKPDLSVPEGNLMPNGDQVGQPTMKTDGDVQTDRVGTSFAAPVVAGTGAELTSCFSLTGLPPVFHLLTAKTLMLHHASIPAVFGLGRSFPAPDYYGYGNLAALEDMLEDPSWRSTSLILATLYPNAGDLVIDPLPYPGSLHVGGKYRGNILMTVASEPVLDPSFRVEYARSNVDAHLQVMRKDRDGQLRPVPVSRYFQPVAGYETTQIKELRKWAPVKQYRTEGEMSCRGEHLRLSATLLLRDLEAARVARDPMEAATYGVPVVIALTIEDPLHAVQVNSEVAIGWRSRGYVAQEIPVAARVRARFGAPS